MNGLADTILRTLAPFAALPRAGKSSSTDVLLWVGVLIVVTLAGAVLILAIRRRTLAGPRTPDAGSMMDELRAMRDRGQMTPEEFDAAIAAMKARLREQVRGKDAPVPSNRSLGSLGAKPQRGPDNSRTLPPSAGPGPS